MTDFIIGILVSAVTIVFLEIFKKFDKKLIGALALTGIAYIYVGFVWQNIPELIVVSLGVILFMLLSYFGFTKNSIFIIIGLILHGLWDLAFPLFSNAAPKGYDVFCLTVDFILAIYFYFRLKLMD